MVAVGPPLDEMPAVVARLPGGENIIAVFRERHLYKPGEKIHLAPQPGLVHLFDAETGQRL